MQRKYDACIPSLPFRSQAPKNDCHDLAAALREMDFEVLAFSNLTKEQGRTEGLPEVKVCSNGLEK